MASTLFKCRFCGEGGRHTTNENGRPPSDDASLCDESECRDKDAAEKGEQAVVEAEQALDAAQATYDAVVAVMPVEASA